MTGGAREQGRGSGGLSRRSAAWLAWSVWTLCVALAASAVVLALYRPPVPLKGLWEWGWHFNWGVVIAVSLLTYPTVGAFVASRRPENIIGWIMCGVGLLCVTEGFALVAWPADYGSSGVQTFIVNQDGGVFQKDLGEETATIVETIQAFDPDNSWSRVTPIAVDGTSVAAARPGS